MHSPPRIGRRRPLHYTGPMRREFIRDTLLEIQGRWFFQEMRNDFSTHDEEFAEVSAEGIGDLVKPCILSTLYLCKVKYYGWFYLKKKTIRRKILRVTDFLYGNDGESLRCESFLDNQALRDIAVHILTHLAIQLGYAYVEYIDMSNDRSARYPENLPEARIYKP